MWFSDTSNFKSYVNTPIVLLRWEKIPSIHVLVHSFKIYSRSFLKYLNFMILLKDLIYPNFSICDHGSEKGLKWGKKIRIWVFSIFCVVLYRESLCEYFMAISKVFFEIWPFIYKPHYKPCFCFQLIFYCFSY